VSRPGGPDWIGLGGPQTWRHLFDGEDVPPPAILDEPLAYRSLALTGSFETGAPIPDCFAGLSGDFDDQGISFGALQWNFGQGSLQPLLKRMAQRHDDVMKEVFDEYYPELQMVLEAPREEQMAWARSIQNPNEDVLQEPWRGLFKTLGRREAFQDLQTKASEQLYDAAVDLAREYEVQSERAVALMFDIKVQNGSIPDTVKAQIMREFDQLSEEDGEEARLRIIANRRAEASRPRWIEDVRTRKLTIATGEGTVHGRHYNLVEEYGLRLTEAI
jgi:hypothetical protein